MDAWDYPVLVIVALVATPLVARWWMRMANPKRGARFECTVCGRKEQGMSAEQWRYCPYCGVPKGGRMSDLPSRNPLV